MGFRSNAPNYSPIWRVSTVTWNLGAKPRTLRSEDEILKAKADGEVIVAKTTVLINCSIIFIPDGCKLPNARFRWVGEPRRSETGDNINLMSRVGSRQNRLSASIPHRKLGREVEVSRKRDVNSAIALIVTKYSREHPMREDQVC